MAKAALVMATKSGFEPLKVIDAQKQEVAEMVSWLRPKAQKKNDNLAARQ